VQWLIFRNFAIAVCVEVGQEKSDHDGGGIGENFGGRQPAMAIFVESAERGRSVLDLGWRRFRSHDRHRVMARGCNAHWRQRDKTASTMRAGVVLGGLVENPHHFTGEALPEMARVQAKQTNVEETDHQASLGFALAKRRRASRNTPSRRETSPESTKCPRTQAVVVAPAWIIAFPAA